MKHFLLVFILIFSLAFKSSAQDINGRVDLSNARFISVGEEVMVDGGTPVLLLDKKDSQEKFEPLPVSWQPDMPMVRISSFGGVRLDVPFVTHIPSFFVYVQVLPDKSVIVTERITLILSTQQALPFTRSYPTHYTDILAKQNQRNVDILWASYNHQSIMPSVKNTPQNVEVRFFENEGLPSGVHLFELSYIVPDAVVQEGNATRLFLPLLGDNLPYLTERMQVFVTYPQSSILHKAQAVFGSDNLIQEKAYDVYMDQNARLIYRVSGILPQTVDVRLDIWGDAKAFTSYQEQEKIDRTLTQYAWLIVSLICVFVLWLYFFSSALDLRDKLVDNRYLTKVRGKIYYDLGVLRYFVKRKIDVRTLLAYVVHLVQKNMLRVQVSDEKQIVFIRAKHINANVFERAMLRLLFGRFKKQNTLNALSKSYLKKLRRSVNGNILVLIRKIVFREMLIGSLQVVLAIVALLWLSRENWQIFAGAMIVSVAYLLCVIHFIHKRQFKDLLAQLFNAYAHLKLSAARKREVDVALDNKQDDVEFDDGLSMKDFSDMFLNELSIVKKGQ